MGNLEEQKCDAKPDYRRRTFEKAVRWIRHFFVGITHILSKKIGKLEMTSDHQIGYSEYYVAVLDILGFKDLVLNELDENKYKIARYLEITKGLLNDNKGKKAESKLGTIVISDTIILSIPFGSGRQENISNLRQLCVAIQDIQFKLALNKIWLRGAISSGNTYIADDESQIVGPAYINAYLLEENVAIYPRVILDNKLVSKLNMSSAQELIRAINSPEENQEHDPEKSNILYNWKNKSIKSEIERDVSFFIDYMIYCFTREGELQEIISNIEQSMYKNSAAYSKYRWLVNYLIESCRHHNNDRLYKFDRADLLDQLKILEKL